jgi:Asp-tRNA(Asn)/Glu-tRNA(Gln) amidotransferase A subunit family amidase
LRWEPLIEAWTRLPGGSDASSTPGPLSGAPFAVKDVIDVAGLPTRCGWAALEDRAPAMADAAVVAALRAAGATPVGKTRSTAFAFVDPTITRNPYDPQRTPGGSSSGSGAVVGAGVVPFALGTQTAGSLCRPAAYCGAYAYKPGIGVLPAVGMQPLSSAFDAVGVIAGDFDWLRRVFDVLATAFDIPTGKERGAPLRIGRVLPPEQNPDPDLVRAMDVVEERLAAVGHTIEPAAPSVSFSELLDDHRTVMLFEAARDIGPVVAEKRHQLPPLIAAGLAEGERINGQQSAAAMERIRTARTRFWADVAGFDLLLAYPTSGAAPVGLTTTGDQSYLTPWTTLGGPLVTMPCGVDGEGMPLAALLAAPPGFDAALMRMAAEIDPLLPRVKRPDLQPV